MMDELRTAEKSQNNESDNSGLLWHYTSEGGLLGIIESDNIRATHVRFLNDWTEFKEAFKEEYVEELVNAFRAGVPQGEDELADKVTSAVISPKNFHRILKVVESSGQNNETFVCSFTSDGGDRLSQWRGYSKSSQAFSLGFDKSLLNRQAKTMNAPNSNAHLVECLYSENKRVDLFKEIGADAAKLFGELKSRNENVPSQFDTLFPDATEEYRKIQAYTLISLSNATANFFTKAARIKHEGFSEEAEWRIIFQAGREKLFPVKAAQPGNDFVKFRSGQYGQTPYVEIPLGLRNLETSPLRTIRVGPGTHKEDAMKWVELILCKFGIKKYISVDVSSIPYR